MARFGDTAHSGLRQALRVAEVRWGPEAADEFFLRNSPDIRAAQGVWDPAPALLVAPR